MSAPQRAVASAIHKYGEPVEFTPKGGLTVYLTASVQSETQDALVNSLDQSRYVVYIAAGDLAVPPVKFDRILVRGVIHSLEEDPRLEKLEGVELAYMLRIMG